MLDCWQVSPQRRPTFTELSQHLTKMFSDERVSTFFNVFSQLLIAVNIMNEPKTSLFHDGQ